jgi:hypothetical protein
VDLAFFAVSKGKTQEHLIKGSITASNTTQQCGFTLETEIKAKVEQISRYTTSAVKTMESKPWRMCSRERRNHEEVESLSPSAVVGAVVRT